MTEVERKRRQTPEYRAWAREYSKKWRKDNPEKYKGYARKAFLKRSFGITVEEYQRMLEKQDGGCAICKKKTPDTNYNRAFCVDHDHKTGRIRGLLCMRCNYMLGHAKDRPEVLEAGAAYLRTPVI